MSSPGTIYVTTPIYYVNDRPHIGHVYTTTVCDVYARAQRLLGQDVFFLTGTDEHGVKVEQSATARGISPQELADENAAEFQSIMATFNLTNDDFIRTTMPHHERQVQEVVRRLQATGAIELGKFEGWYDKGQEEYYTENKARELEYISPISKKPLERASEENYYFKLSNFQERLEAHFEANPDFVRPNARLNEVLGRLREGLNDVPMSRTNFSWGVPMPDDDAHVIYVWIDALINYISGLGLLEADSTLYRERCGYWPAAYHVIGKEILWFHAVIWPAMLMALELPLPKCIYAHSFWISEGEKMSKTLGNFIDLEQLNHYADTYSLDTLRYYLATQGPLGATDSNFVAAQFHEVYSTDLVNTIGNCASRVTAMMNKYFDGNVAGELIDGTPLIIDEHNWPDKTAAAVVEYQKCMDAFDLSGAAAEALGIVRAVDGFIHETAPFKLAKDPEQLSRVGAILYQCLEAVRIASVLLWPFMPEKMNELWSALNLAIDPQNQQLNDLCAWGGLTVGGQVEKVALFPRLDAPATTKA